MMTYQKHALELLYLTEKVYAGTNRDLMKKSFVEVINHTENLMLQCCPLYMGLVTMAGLKMLDECPDYD